LTGRVGFAADDRVLGEIARLQTMSATEPAGAARCRVLQVKALRFD